MEILAFAYTSNRVGFRGKDEWRCSPLRYEAEAGRRGGMAGASPLKDKIIDGHGLSPPPYYD